MVPDAIERETIIAAPVERVWALLTKAEHIAAWFAFGGADVELRPGGALRFRWREHGEFHGVVDAVEPARRLAFRWALTPGAAPAAGNATQVEFTLEPEGDGTRLRVVERGFRALAGTDADRARHVADNTEGWSGAFTALRGHVDSRAGHVTSSAHEPVEDRHAVAGGDADVAVIGLGPAHPQSLAVFAEQPADVRREVREEVARIFVLGDAPARQPRLEAVDRAAAVGVDQAPEELLRIPIDDRALPVGKHDRPLVLATSAASRERQGPMLGVAPDDDARVFAVIARRYPIRDGGEPCRGVGVDDDLGVTSVQRDSQVRRSPVYCYVAVTEIQAEQVGVRPWIGWPPLHEQMFPVDSDGYVWSAGRAVQEISE